MRSRDVMIVVVVVVVVDVVVVDVNQFDETCNLNGW